MARAHTVLLIIFAAAASSPTVAEPVSIALIEDRGESFELQAMHSEQGFRLGLEYATGGTMSVHGREIELSVMYYPGDPTTAADLLAEAYRDNRADLAISMGSSAATLAMLPVAEAFKRILLVELANADAITGSRWNRYVFRTAHSASQDALASVRAVGSPELNLFVVAQDTADGHDAVDALKEALQRIPRGVFYVSSYFVRSDETDIGEAVSSQFEALHDLHGAKTLLMMWVGSRPPIDEIAATNPGRFGIRLALSGDIDPNARASASRTAIEGVTSYFYSMPTNRVNEWLIANWRARYGERPDSFAAAGMTAAVAVVEALARTASADAEELITAMEGLIFETPKGQMNFRPQDHQALQAMYYFRVKPRTSPEAPELVHEIAIPEIPLPIRIRQHR